MKKNFQYNLLSMKKLTSITKALALFIVMFVTSTVMYGENICDTAIYIKYDVNTKDLIIHFGETSKTKYFYISKEDIESVFDVSLNNETDGWYFFMEKIDTRVKFTTKKNSNVILPYYLNKDDRKNVCYMEIKAVAKATSTSTGSTNATVVSTENTNMYMWLYVTIGILVVVIVVLLVFIFVIKKRRIGQIGGDNASNNVITAVEEVKTDSHKGLQHVLSNKKDYYAVNMNEVFHDTAIKTVYFSRVIVGKLNAFFKDFLGNTERTNETGCYLIGCWDYHEDSKQYDISIEYMVQPGKDAVFDEYTLSFGREIGISSGTMIDDLVEKTKNDYVRTSWMHSHPGLGLFLSAHDLVVQKQLAYSDAPNRLLAIVIDTNTPDWQMAMFTPKINGVMNNKQDLKKTISFDTIYAWSRTRPAIQTAASEYFTLRVNIPGFNTINFTGKAINQIDDAIYSNKNGIAGYFYGTKRGSDIFIDKCLQYNNVDSLGCFVNDPRTQCNSIPTGLIANVDNCDFVMVCCDGNMMSLFVKKDSFYQKCTQCDTIFREYKEWTRRKRI